jgi:hypothetical protein
MLLIEFRDVDWERNDMRHVTVTCQHHTDARYLMKDPARNLHFIQPHWTREVQSTDGRDFVRIPDFVAIEAAVERGEAISILGECTCPFNDLRIIVNRDLPIRRESPHWGVVGT